MINLLKSWCFISLEVDQFENPRETMKKNTRKQHEGETRIEILNAKFKTNWKKIVILKKMSI